MTFTLKQDLDRAKMNQTSSGHFVQKLLYGHTDTHTDPIAVRGRPKVGILALGRNWEMLARITVTQHGKLILMLRHCGSFTYSLLHLA